MSKTHMNLLQILHIKKWKLCIMETEAAIILGILIHDNNCSMYLVITCRFVFYFGVE